MLQFFRLTHHIMDNNMACYICTVTISTIHLAVRKCVVYYFLCLSVSVTVELLAFLSSVSSSLCLSVMDVLWLSFRSFLEHFYTNN